MPEALRVTRAGPYPLCVSVAAPPPAAPVDASERIVALDVLRGFALFGVFMVNLNYVSGPYMGVVGPDAPASEQVARAVLKGLFESKFVTLFSLLFGMGLVLQLERAAARGVELRRTYLRRLGILSCMGVLHGVLLFEGDILFLYSLVGLALFLCHRWSAPRLALVSIIPFTIGVALTSAWALFVSEDALLAGDAEFAQDSLQAATEGPLWFTLRMRALSFVFIQVFFTAISFNWRVLGLFFLGAALMKVGFFKAENRARLGRLAALALPLGLALEGLDAYVGTLEAGPGAVALAGALGHELGSLLLAFGLAAAVVWSVLAGFLPRPAGWLACAGRMALTNYLAQSVLLNIVLYWYGFGLWGELSQWTYMGIVVVLFAGQVALSVWWLRRLAIGPMEWVWRALTYGKKPAWR